MAIRIQEQRRRPRAAQEQPEVTPVAIDETALLETTETVVDAIDDAIDETLEEAA